MADNKRERLIISEHGGPDQLHLVSDAIPEPGTHEVLIRQIAAGINFIDIYHRSGLYPLASMPHGLGVEGVGEIVKFGSRQQEQNAAARGQHVGTRVAYVGVTPGCYASHLCLPLDKLISVPVDIASVKLAACMLRALTVEYLVERCAPAGAGQTILFHAIAGGVGQIACQWLKRLQVEVIGTAGSKEKCRIAQNLGCNHVINYRDESFATAVQSITDNQGVPIVYDSIGATTFMDSLSCLSRRGTLVSYGNASGPVTGVDLGLLAKHRSVYVTRPILADYIASRVEYETACARVFAMLRDGIDINIYRQVALAEVASIHIEMEQRLTSGQSVIVFA